MKEARDFISEMQMRKSVIHMTIRISSASMKNILVSRMNIRRTCCYIQIIWRVWNDMEPDIGIIEKNKTFETSQRALIWSILQYGKFYFSAFI